MTHLKSFPGVARRAVALVAAALCGTAALAEDGVTSTEIQLGGSSALSGPIAAACSLPPIGAQAFFKVVNDAGGIHGRKITYTVLDDAYSIPRAVGNVKRLVERDKVFAIFGGCGTNTSGGIASALEGSPVPYLFPLSALPALTQPVKRNVFALLPPYTVQIDTVLPHAIKQTGAKTAALTSFNAGGYQQWMESTRNALKAAGVAVVVDETMEETSLERSTFAIKVKQASPDLLLLIDTPVPASRMVAEMARQNFKPKLIAGASSLADQNFLNPLSAEEMPKLLSVNHLYPVDHPRAKDCIDALAKFDPSLKPSRFTQEGCVAAKVLVEAMRRAGPGLTRAGLIASLESMKDFDPGVSTRIGFSATNHLGVQELLPIGIENGKFAITGAPMPVLVK